LPFRSDHPNQPEQQRQNLVKRNKPSDPEAACAT